MSKDQDEEQSKQPSQQQSEKQRPPQAAPSGTDRTGSAQQNDDPSSAPESGDKNP
jgi:hypothetical protein